jgi:spore coat protein U-like protein
MRVRNWLRAAGIAASMALMLGGTAPAATVSGTLPVSANITNNCAFGTINSLSFGAYDPVVANATSDLPSSSTFALTCTSGAAITMGLSLGGNAVASQRNMKDGGSNTLSYDLFQDAAHSTAWNETTTEASTGTGSSVTYTVYGVVPHGQNVPAGSYTDSVSIDVNY